MLDYIPPVQGLEKAALKIYFISNTFLVFSPLLAIIQTESTPVKTGWVIYLVGLGIQFISMVQYCRENGLKKNGVCRFSRNPVCVGYFLIYIGTALLIGSWFHLILTLLYQASVHSLIFSEERWCREIFGEDFRSYQEKTPRHILIKDFL